MRSFQETIDARRRDLGLTVEDVFERLDRYAWPPDAKPPALATLGHWFNGTRRRPRAMIHIKALCDVLELEMGCAFGAPSLQTETDVERQILRKLRAIDPDDHAMVLLLLDHFMKRSRPRPSKR